MAQETLLQPGGAAGKDTHLAKNFPTTNYGSDDWGKVERDAEGSILCHMLFQFDLSGLSVSSGTGVAFAALFWRNAWWASGGTRPVTRKAHRITAEWNEGEATWNNRKSGVGWGTAGGDFESSAAHSRVEQADDGLAVDQWHCHALTQLVRDWLDEVCANYGVLIRYEDETSADTWAGVRTSDRTTASERPFLWVENFDSPMHLLPIGEGYDTDWEAGAIKDKAEAVRLPPSLSAGVEPLDNLLRSPTSGEVWHRQSFTTTGNVPAGAVISSVKVKARASRYSTSGNTEINLGVRVGASTCMHGAGGTTLYSWSSVEREWTTNPTTGQAWTAAEVNAMEPVIERTGGSVACRLSRLYVEVTYEPAVETDSGAVDKERAGYYRLERIFGKPGSGHPQWGWKWYPGVEASLAGQDSGAAAESASIAHHLVAAEEAGAAADALIEPPPVEHDRADPAQAADLAALWCEIALLDDQVTGDDGAVLELNPLAGADAGAAADIAQTPVGSYEDADAALGADAETGLSAELAGISDAAAALESAQRIAILSRHIARCTIESSLDALADAFDLALAESDPSDPLTPRAQAWHSLGEGDLVQVRLGLAGVGMDDYGVFRIDGAAARRSEASLSTELHGRDRAALLIEERWRSASGFRIGAYEEQDPTQLTRPTCRTIAGRLAALVGLGLVWEAPDYPLKEFSIRPDEPISSALGRLLEPLRRSRRYRSDAWVDGDNLVVRRRGDGPIVGALDCRQGLVRSITRERQPAVGEIVVRGGTEVVLTVYDADSDRDHGETEASQVQIEDDGSGRRVVKTFIRQSDGRWVQSQDETEEQTYEEVSEGGRWTGRLLVASKTTVKSNLHLPAPKTERRVTRLGYDDAHRLVLREEETFELSSGEWAPRGKTLIRYEQATPTDVRVTTTEWKIVAGKPRVKSGFPRSVEQPGTLQSGLRTASSPDHAWASNEDGSAPQQVRASEVTVQYEGRATGTPDGLPIEVSLPSLMSHAACQQIADDIASESGLWRYRLELFWPRPLPYRKGDRVTLSNLPAEMPDMTAVATRVRTDFDVERAAWTHDVQLECWGES